MYLQQLMTALYAFVSLRKLILSLTKKNLVTLVNDLYFILQSNARDWDGKFVSMLRRSQFVSISCSPFISYKFKYSNQKHLKHAINARYCLKPS